MKKTFTIIIMLCSFITFSQIPTAGLVAYYPFSGNANDASGNNLNGVVNGATLTTDRFGNPNKAYNFNGTSNYIRVSNSPLLQIEAWSLSAWYKTSGPLTGTGRITTKQPPSSGTNYLTVMMGGPDTIVGSAWNGSSAIPTPDNTKTNNNVWHHVVYIRDNTLNKYYIYVDNVLKNTVNDGFGALSNTADLMIGCSHLFNQYWFGDIDDIRIYNRAVTTLEVGALFNETSTGINSLSLNESLVKAFPNPTEGKISIQNNNVKQVKIRITNSLGQLFYYYFMEVKEITLDLSEYNSGMYFVQISDEEGRILSVKKLIKN